MKSWSVIGRQGNHRHMDLGYWRLVFVAAVAIFGVANAFGGVNIFPTEVFVAPPNRSAPITVTNPTDSLLEVWVTFGYGYPVKYDSGKVVMYLPDSVYPGEPSAAGWLRAIPQRFSLRPQESQVVRLYGVPPPGTPTGEYWARVVVSSKPRTGPVIRNQQQTRVTMDIVTQTSVPFHFRNGLVSSSIAIRQAGAYIDDGFLRLQLKLQRLGNASFWGRINYKLLNASGKLLRTKDFRLVVYKDMDYMALDTLPSVYAGPYTVELLFDGNHPSLGAQYRLNSEPIVQRIPVTVK